MKFRAFIHFKNSEILYKDLFLCFFFMIFWIIPIAYVGLRAKDISFLPRTFNYLYRLSFLFTHRAEVWPIYFIQVLPENSQEWITVNEEEYFHLKPFGYRTRLNQLLMKTHYSMGFNKEWNQTRDARHEELARWIAKRYSKIYPQKEKIQAVRILEAEYPIEANRPYQGRWRQPPLSFFSEKQIKVMSMHYL